MLDQPSCNVSGSLNERPSSLRLKGISDRRRRHGEENRLHAEREEPIARASAAAAMKPYHRRAPVRDYRIERETNAVGADAEEHHMRERHDGRIMKNRS